MQTERYQANPYGQLAWDRLGNWDFSYFLPAAIPRSLTLGENTNLQLQNAEAALGALSGSAVRASDFELLSRAIALTESLSSSRIEGTQSTLDEVLENNLSMEQIRSEDLREVFNYLAAAQLGQGLLAKLPISQRLFLKVQRVLLTEVRGEEKTPGSLRTSPVWIGPSGMGPADAQYIPPLPHHLQELLADWEKFVNDSKLPTVLWLALAHYQFQTIHPLLDGNGRVGRILIELMLISRGVIPRVALGISEYIERNRDDYYRFLQGVREKGELGEWVGFFAKAVATQARSSRALLIGLIDLRDNYAARLNNPELARALVTNPRPSVARLQQEMRISQPTASKYLRRAEKLGILLSLGKSGRGNKERWVTTEVWNLIQVRQNG